MRTSSDCSSLDLGRYSNDLLLRRQHPTCAPNLVNILLQQVAQLERIVRQLVSEDEGGTTHGELDGGVDGGHGEGQGGHTCQKEWGHQRHDCCSVKHKMIIKRNMNRN